MVASLVLIHKRQRAERLRERAEYHWEQIKYVPSPCSRFRYVYDEYTDND